MSETIGFKTGLALTEERLQAIVQDIDQGLWPPSDDLERRFAPRCSLKSCTASEQGRLK
jgi:hypothetical protein